MQQEKGNEMIGNQTLGLPILQPAQIGNPQLEGCLLRAWSSELSGSAIFRVQPVPP
jgi:hypothetical protein